MAESEAVQELADIELTTQLADVPEVGDNIELKSPRWSFSGNTADHFDEHVSRSIPGYEAGHEIIAQLSDFFITPGSRVAEIGCSTAALTAKLAARHREADAKFLGIDIVPEMVAQARQRCMGLPNVNIELGDALRVDYSDCSLVIMYYTLQFVPTWKRPALIKRICTEMLPGGALILFEKARSPEARMQDMFNQCYEEYKQNQGFTAEEILGKSRSLRSVLEPFTTEENMRLLSEAGFSSPQLVQKQLVFEGIIGVKSVLGS
ncbi:methyltransferase domain-containing protein [Streptomyces sp. NPDC006739]|uniref:methyltransferase domain-containing protein n=1 Tax=Streptomyces sp. NPDC006739 TaxID=3364763 RepID=UPI0036B1EF75